MKKLIFALASIVIFTSCEDELDRIPVDQLTPDTAFRNLDDLETNLLGVYDAYPTFGELAVNSIASDNTAIGPENGGQRVPLYQLNIAAAGGDQNLYFVYSRMHNRASRVIENAGIVNVDEEDTDEVDRRDNIVGQAYALRAFAHFKMFEYFTPDYENPNGLSVPYVDFVAGSSDFPARATVTEFNEKFNADLDQAEDLLSDDNGVDRVNEYFITFLRARHALTVGNNDAAVDFANDIIDNSGTELAEGQDYIDMFYDRNNIEVIFKRAYVIGEARIAGVWYFTGSGGEIMKVSQDLKDAIDSDNDPLRSELIFEEENASGPAGPGRDGPAGPGKYPGRDGIAYLNDMKEMRISEAYLIVAEASAKLGRFDDAEDAIEELRDARLEDSDDDVDYDNETEALDDILAERRLELAFEGHRWKDLKRNNRGFTRADEDCGGGTPCGLDADDFRFTLPIPLTEVGNNPNITENNPGY